MPNFVEYPDFKTVVLSIEPPRISDAVRARAEADGFSLKDEFHITVFYKEYLEQTGNNGYSAFVEAIQALPLPAYELTDTMYHIALPKTVDGTEYPRESLIVPVESAELKAVIEQCTQGLIMTSFLHTTCFTKPDNPPARIGIGIPSIEKWQSLNPKVYSQDWQE